MRLTIDEVRASVNGALASECGVSGEVSSVTWDSREIEPGALYVALPGERVDGHDFVPAAFAAGARCAAVERVDEEMIAAARVFDAALIVVPDTVCALTDLAAAWRSRLGGLVVGLTGSTGKTTTKNLVRTVLERAGSVVATKANQNNELGVPRTLLAADVDTRFTVVEMGMRGAGQIAELCSFAQPAWGLVTNAGESHIELLGGREAIARAKTELYCALPSGGFAFVNIADERAGLMRASARLLERGVEEVLFDGSLEADARREALSVRDRALPAVWARSVRLDGAGCAHFMLVACGFEGSTGVSEVPCSLALAGVHNVSNAVAAAAVGCAAGLDLKTIAEALAQSRPEQGRQELLRTSDGALVVNDAYNANPDSMRASLSTFASLDVSGARIAVLGDMGELGDFSEECHRRVGSFAAVCNLDLLVCVGELATLIAASAVEAGMPSACIVCCADAQEALDIVRSRLAPVDAVLVKASHFMGFERIVKGLVS